jgi:three-Cys-motif partner protein
MVKYRDNEPEKWTIREHTKVKHEILARYLIPWLRILSSFNRRLIIVDGFAGRGEYVDESNKRTVIDGSPIILMDLSLQPIVDELICICIERNYDNYNNLCRVLEEKKLKRTGPKGTIVDFSNVNIRKFSNQNLKTELDKMINQLKSKYIKASERAKALVQKTTIFVINAKFDEIVKHIILLAKNNDIILAPSFYFIDPFGFNGVPFQLIKNILLLSKTEVLLTFMTRDINRFNPLPQEEKALQVLFNNTDWRQGLGNKGEEFFLNFYKSILKKSGIKYVIHFRMFETDRRSTIYYLIHASNNLKAVDLMKETMKNVNPDFAYYGPDNKKLGREQARLDTGHHPLVIQLCNMYKGQSVSFNDIRSDTIDSNSYIEKEYRQVIKNLEKENRVKVDRKESKKMGIKDGDIILFL